MNDSHLQNKNHLGNETSPYLLQHAYNPVHWYPWGDEAFEKAKSENKPVLLSIGYSSCHWCHVMAHESFENDSIADIMNEHFVNIKLDREERPDIDNIYMDAVQAMGMNGGWPLNVFLTPDQKPFYGGTYFPPAQWANLLQSIHDAYQTKYEALENSAEKLASTLQTSEYAKYGLSSSVNIPSTVDLAHVSQELSKKFDTLWGGIKKAPKFPMPSLWNYLLMYGHLAHKQDITDHVLFTLDKIAEGGIYDQIGGGFARYSVDGEWHVPHFEKMLYDNGQLMALYAEAYKLTGKANYKHIILGVAEWLQREMVDVDGGFYSALDADSEGEEGKYYVWAYEELKDLLGGDLSIYAEYYDISRNGNWEHGKNVLRIAEDLTELAKSRNSTPQDAWETISSINKKLLGIREKRIRPSMDTKKLTGWNGLMLQGLCKAYQAIGDATIEQLARDNARFLATQMKLEGGALRRILGKEQPGFLEDYAAVIEAFITYYETFYEPGFLLEADRLVRICMEQFYDEDEVSFFYTASGSEALIARKKELFDNVIPSSNSMMAINLHRLGTLLDKPEYRSLSQAMMERVSKLMSQEIEYLSNWGTASLWMSTPTKEVLVIGDQFTKMSSSIQRHYHPNAVFMASAHGNKQLSLMAEKYPLNGQTTIFVCEDKTCKQPVHDVHSALQQMER